MIKSVCDLFGSWVVRPQRTQPSQKVQRVNNNINRFCYCICVDGMHMGVDANHRNIIYSQSPVSVTSISGDSPKDIKQMKCIISVLNKFKLLSWVFNTQYDFKHLHSNCIV